MKKFGVIRFLGTNCDRDVFQAIEGVGLQAEWLWYENHFDSNDYQALFLPGGFSYGDYLRCGALAAKAPVMDSVREAAKRGTPILGICNGFQILCESGLLPGALLKNKGLRFIENWVELEGKTEKGFWKSVTGKGWSGKLPIAHGEGQYHAPKDVLDMLFDQGRVLSTYRENPNGSARDIAGITNESGNVCALMPHPERAFEKFHGSTDGRRFFEVFR
jgi:phosphoribosylformylglycinamidine synthase